MRSSLMVLSVLLSSAALVLACNDEMPPPATPSAPAAPVTTVVIDAGAPVAQTPMVAVASPPDVGADAGSLLAVAAVDAGPSTASGPDFTSCSTAADCVAVPKNDCCHNGYKEAVNKSSVDAYKASAPKCDPKRKCPMFRILDKRTPDCNAGKCVLVPPSGNTPSGGTAVP